MKKILSMMGLVALLFLTLSCDSLWKVSDSASVEFKLNLEEILASSTTTENNAKTISSRAVLPGFENDDDNEELEVFVTLNNSASDKEIAKKILTIDEAQSTNVVFDSVAARQRIYAKIEILDEDEELYFRARSSDVTIKVGQNTLVAKPNVIFLTSSGGSLTADGSAIRIQPGNDNGRTNADVLQDAYEKMSANGKLLPGATVIINDDIDIEEDEIWTFPSLAIKVSSESLVIVKQGATLTLENVAITSSFETDSLDKPPVLKIENGGIIELQGLVTIDTVQYEPTSARPHPMRVTGDLHEDSRIILFATGASEGSVLVENAGGSFTKDNFVIAGDLETSFDSNENLIVKPPTMYTLTFDANNGGQNPSSIQVEEGKTPTSLPVLSRNGFAFDGWFENRDGTGNKFTENTVVTKDVTLYAKWTEVLAGNVVVTFDAMGGKVDPASKQIPENTAYGTLPEPTRDGHTFDAWYTDTLFTTGFTESTIVTDSITVYANWTINSYTVTFNINGGDGNNTTETVQYEGTVSTLPEPTRNAHRFDGWFENVDGTGDEFTESTPVTAHITLYAKWHSLITYTLRSNGESYYIASTDNSLKGDIVIPSMYDGLNGELPVTYINAYAFRRNNEITSIDIPEGVTDIGENAFYECRALQSVDMPSSITTIGQLAFYACSALESITIPDGVTEIKTSTFNSCRALETVTIGSASLLATIGERAFSDTAITSIALPQSLNEIGTSAFSGTTLQSITIPNSVNSLGGAAFYNCTELTSVTLGTGTTVISDSLFRGSSKLSSVTMNGQVTTIAQEAFSGCSALQNIELKDSITTVGQEAFMNSGLTEVTIPNGVTELSKQAFYGCSSLATVIFQGDVTSIGEATFQRTTALKNISIPATVTTIGSQAFEESGLTAVELPEGIEAINMQVFNKCSALTNVTMGSNVTTIGTYAFGSCTSLDTINFSAALTSIGSSAFSDCSALTTVNFNGKLETIGSTSFSGTGLINVTIPSSVRTIGAGAFSTSSLKTLVIPSTVTTVGVDIVASNISATITVTGVESADELPSTWDTDWHNGAVVTYENGSSGVTYTVTFDPTGYGSLADSVTSTVTKGNGKIDLPPHPIPNNPTTKYFIGWYTRSSSGELCSSETVFNEDTTIYAQYDTKDENYTYELNEQGYGMIISTENSSTQPTFTMPSTPEGVGVPITEVSSVGFKNYDATTFDIPRTIEKIGAQAFNNTVTTIKGKDNSGTIAGYATSLGGSVMYNTWQQAYDANVDVYPVWAP